MQSRSVARSQCWTAQTVAPALAVTNSKQNWRVCNSCIILLQIKGTQLKEWGTLSLQHLRNKLKSKGSVVVEYFLFIRRASSNQHYILTHFATPRLTSYNRVNLFRDVIIGWGMAAPDVVNLVSPVVGTSYKVKTNGLNLYIAWPYCLRLKQGWTSVVGKKKKFETSRRPSKTTYR